MELPPSREQLSTETYAGYGRTERFASGHLARDSKKPYSLPRAPALNQWGLDGPWIVESERVVLQTAPGKIQFRFHSRDLHMVLAPRKNAGSVRFQVRLNGAPPGADCGMDCNAEGLGEVREARLYQLIRQKSRVEV
jgi:hypothetical protein